LSANTGDFSGNVNVTGNVTASLFNGNLSGTYANLTGQVNAASLYASGNVGIGVVPSSTIALGLSKTWASDAILYNTNMAATDSNTAMTAARTKYGVVSSVTNLNENRDATGASRFDANYFGGAFQVINGSTVSGGNAFASSTTGVSGQVYNYANGSRSNTANVATGMQGVVYQFGSGVIDVTATGGDFTVAAGNNSITGNITQAVGVRSIIISNTAMTIGTGYLYYGAHSGATTTTKYGVYITGEANNYFSGNVSIAGSLATGNTTITGSLVATKSVTISNTGGIYQAGSIYSDGNWGMLYRAAQLAPVSAQFGWKSSDDATEYMRISPTGNVGIGNTAPASKLVVSGNVDFRTANILLDGVVSGGFYKGNNSNSINQAAAGNIFRVNSNTLTASVTFAAGENGTATGPVAIQTGISLIISTGARVSIV
jgi:hypothetical protein